MAQLAESKEDQKSKNGNLERYFTFISKSAVFVAILAILYRNYDCACNTIFNELNKDIDEELKRRESVLQALLSIERNWVRPEIAPLGRLFEFILVLKT